VLNAFGYRVITAVDGADAVEKFSAHRDAIGLLLFDLIMPNRNGKDAYDEIRKVSPCMRVLFMSGYTADIIEAKTLDRNAEVITKPFSPDALARRLRAILDDMQPGSGQPPPGSVEPGNLVDNRP
jgi:DNA-binding response OmpR family regulator